MREKNRRENKKERSITIPMTMFYISMCVIGSQPVHMSLQIIAISYLFTTMYVNNIKILGGKA